MVLDEFRDVGAEELRYICFETVFKEHFVQELGAGIVSCDVVPADHEVVAVSAVPDGFLVHDTEIFAVFESLFAAFMGVDANYFHVACRSLEVV